MQDLRWGILGAAKFAREFMAPALALAPGGHLAALATSDPAKAAPFHAIVPGLRVHSSYDALINDPAIDAVYIPLPNHPQWQRARQLLAEGAIGKLWRIDSAFAYNNRDPHNIRNQAALGGGGLRDIGVYVMGSARFATGLEPTDVQARLQWENGVDVYATLSARFGDVDFSSFTSTRMHPRQEMAFHGEDGVLRLPVPFNARSFGQAEVQLHRGLETITERWPSTNHYELQVAAFNRAVREGGGFACPLEFSRGTQGMMDAAFAADARC